MVFRKKHVKTAVVQKKCLILHRLRTWCVLLQSKKSETIMNNTSKTVYLGMIGDIMHPGLINIINEGAKYGQVMIGLFTDKAIATHKRLPYLNYEQRKNVIENIKGVSSIVPQDEWS